MDSNNNDKNIQKDDNLNVHKVVNVEEREVSPKDIEHDQYMDELESLIKFFEETSPSNRKKINNSVKTKRKLINAAILSSVGVVGAILSRRAPEFINNQTISELLRNIGDVISFIGISGAAINLISSSFID